MGNAASSLPFSIGKPIATHVNHGWALHDGQRKSDGSAVSVFMAKKPSLMKTPLVPQQPHLTQYTPALHHYVHSKKLRHPHILTVIATLDTDNPNETAPSNSTSSSSSNGDLIIVTEACIPFSTWVSSTQNPPSIEQIVWGLECVVRALSFLHSSAQMCHGCVSLESLYVTPAGDVKLWNFAILSSFENASVPRHFTDYEGAVTPTLYRSPERSEGRWDAIGAAGIHVLDSYSVGILIGQIFPSGIPTPLVKAVQRLQTTNLKMRPKLAPLLKCPVFDTPYQKLQCQLEEFAIAPVENKILFWQNITPQLPAQLLPPNVVIHRILPLIQSEIATICGNESLRAQESYRKEVLAMLSPLFYIAERMLDTSTIGVQLGKVIAILYKVNDRAIRGTLLQKAPFMAECFDKNTLNEAVFEPMCGGFSDSSAALRELTLKATAALVPHLTHPNLEKLSRYLVRLQSDPESSIRTNTVIFFSKLAPHLTEVTRQKILLPAFVRAMKDPFTPCRLAALRSTVQAKTFFDPAGLASRVLPAITPQLLDPSPEVRREAFTAVDDLLFVLRQESERLATLPVPESATPMPLGATNATSGPPMNAAPMRPTTKAPAAAPAPSSGSFSITGISSWMSSSSKATAVAPAAAAMPAPPATTHAPHNKAAPPSINYVPPSTAMNQMNMQDDWDDEAKQDDNGWDEDVNQGDDDGGWGDDDDLDVSNSAPNPVRQTSAIGSVASVGASSLFASTEDDDFFGGLDAKPAKPTISTRPTVGKLVVPSKVGGVATKGKLLTTKPAVQKLSTKDNSGSDGWDDF